MADEAKAKGNEAFSSGDFTSAVNHFTEAINLAPTNHVLFSNRSAVHESLSHHYEEALSDAKKTVELKPDWAKGYSRLGAAHIGLNHLEEAVEAYTKGLEIDPSNETLKSGLADASRSRAAPPNPFGDAFKGPEMWAKLTADPSTRGFLKQSDFVNMMQEIHEIQRNPSNLNLYLKDQRVMQSLGVLLNVQIRTQAGDEAEAMEEDEMIVNEPKVDKKREPEPEPEVAEEKERKEKALKEKEMGNAAYKKKDFETAIKHYCTLHTMEIDDEYISYITNRAAVHLEMGKYDECIKDCDKAVERGRELRSDYKMVAKALTRKGTALGKMAKVSIDYEPVIEIFQKALTEHRNEFLKEQKYLDAVKHYTKAIKRNPKDPRAYSYRAACYTKLGAMPEGLKDAEKCIELDPTFSKGYSRKGAVQFFMKEYHNAMETCVQQINKANRGDLTPEELKERQAKGMQDPEIQNTLTDPVMRQVLSDLQENPAAAQKHMQNPMIMNKMQKLISSGMVQMK
ncbi:LOW QUALITY PROTEIN: hypothetical protein N665_0090s0038 [Sinapis alba]|nr:LOW QUALITY PROTEIN: hypothetical protein N665_0090s0038 [Sinapis alba]